MLQDKILEVFKRETACIMAINGALVGNSKGRSRGSVYYSDAKAAGKIKSGEEANALIQKKRFKDANPSEAASLVSEVILEVNKYIDTLLEASSDPIKRVNYRKDIKAAESCTKIVEELDLYVKKLTFLANSKPIGKDDDLALGLKRFKPPLGLVIHVLDDNALAWGEKVPKLEDTENDYEDEDSGDTEGKEAAQAVSKSEDQWRPQVDYRYPFTAKSTLNFKKSNYDFVDKTSYNSKDLTFAVFFNVKKGDKKTTTTTTAIDTNVPPSEPQPTAFVVFCKNDNSVVKRFELGKSRNALQVVNFFELISDSHLKDMENIQLMIAFEDPTNPGSLLNDESRKDPVLLLNIATATSDEFEYEDDSDDDDDEDEDSDEDNDEDSDDSDAYDGDYCDYCADALGRQAEEMRDDLPVKTTFHGHEHELHRLDYIYAGDYGCDYCEQQGKGLVYHCHTCNYDAHPQCACEEVFEDSFRMMKEAEKMKDELPLSVLKTDFHEHALSRLDATSSNSNNYSCDHCDCDGVGLVYHCVACQFTMHPQCVFPEKFDEIVMKQKAAEAKRASLLLSVQYEEHYHALQLMDNGEEYCCDHCGDDGKGLVYRCAMCNFDLHPQCAVPETFGLLQLSVGGKYEDQEEEEEEDEEDDGDGGDDGNEDEDKDDKDNKEGDEKEDEGEEEGEDAVAAAAGGGDDGNKEGEDNADGDENGEEGGEEEGNGEEEEEEGAAADGTEADDE